MKSVMDESYLIKVSEESGVALEINKKDFSQSNIVDNKLGFIRDFKAD